MANLSEALIQWYSHNKRELPWRVTKNPYNIWVSEVILQQTRVNQGISYYYNFIDKFPDIFALANSDIDDLLKLWQGLGYYSRARNMHFTAKEIADKLNGEFPTNYEELIKLKGIGDYTASAIASISFNQPTPVLDGNVFRVLARLHGIAESTQNSKGKKIFKQKLLELIPNCDPGTFNQAIMEFGAIQCTPKNPDCKNCPFNTSCFSYNNNMVDALPIKKIKVKQKTRFFNYLFITYKKSTFIEQRHDNDIWKLLYQIPLIETLEKASIEGLTELSEWYNIFDGLSPEIDINVVEKKHVLSHQIIYARFYKIKINTLNDYLRSRYKKIQITDLQKLGVPRLIENYFKDINKQE